MWHVIRSTTARFIAWNRREKQRDKIKRKYKEEGKAIRRQTLLDSFGLTVQRERLAQLEKWKEEAIRELESDLSAQAKQRIRNREAIWKIAVTIVIIVVITAGIIRVISGGGSSEPGAEAKRAVFYGESCQPPNITKPAETLKCEEDYKMIKTEKEVESAQARARQESYHEKIEQLRDKGE